MPHDELNRSWFRHKESMVSLVETSGRRTSRHPSQGTFPDPGVGHTHAVWMRSGESSSAIAYSALQTRPKGRSWPSDGQQRDSCRSFSCRLSFHAWRSRSVRSRRALKILSLSNVERPVATALLQTALDLCVPTRSALRPSADRENSHQVQCTERASTQRIKSGEQSPMRTRGTRQAR